MDSLEVTCQVCNKRIGFMELAEIHGVPSQPIKTTCRDCVYEQRAAQRISASSRSSPAPAEIVGD